MKIIPIRRIFHAKAQRRKEKTFGIIGTFIMFVALLLCVNIASAQKGILEQVQGRMNNVGGQKSGGADTISVVHRDDLADSITISYRYLDSLRSVRLDSSLNDFYKFYSLPPNYVTLGNNGSAAYPILFTPFLKDGWDAGFHAYDVYKFTLEGTKFYKTTRPFTLLTYLLGTGKEQLIQALHTQNIKPSWNFGFEYRLISAPGLFKTQNTNHNNYRLFSNYQGKRKRYSAYFLIMGNKLKGSENGGIRSDTFLTDPDHSRRFTIPVNLGGDAPYGINIFSTELKTGNYYKDFTFFLRQSYDFGKKDSIQINDSTKEYLFYPKLRFQHTITYTSSTYQFKDTLPNTTDALSDSVFIRTHYDTSLLSSQVHSFFIQDKWKFLSNDFSIRQFPETKNPAQFIDVGLRLENFTGYFANGSKNFYNVVLHGEYRNKTRNRKWDAIAKGDFYPTGFNSGDYSAMASIARNLNSKLGNVQVSFRNVNRSPSYIFNDLSSFNFNNNLSLKKENITMISAEAENPKFSLSFRNISISNYAYFLNYYKTAQYSSLINITQVELSKRSKLSKHLNLYSDFLVQQSASASPIKVPFFYTRQRLAFEGTFFKNLNLSTGFDVNYRTPYKAYDYSPLMGQFIPQDTTSIKNLPDVNFYFNFRIKSFTGIIRVENINTFSFKNGGGFTDNNFAAPAYPTPGLIVRIGVRWGFVN